MRLSTKFIYKIVLNQKLIMIVDLVVGLVYLVGHQNKLKPSASI